MDSFRPVKKFTGCGRVRKKKGNPMSGRTDIAKGRVKEAAGVLSGSNKLREKGKTDQAIGQVKRSAEKAVDKITKKIRK